MMKSQPDNTALTALNQGAERPNVVMKQLNGGAPQVVLSRYYPIHKLFGITKQALLAEDSYSGVGANPASMWKLNIITGPPDQSTDCTIDYSVELTFYTKWKNRIRVAQS